MKPHRQDEQVIAERAAEWLVTLRTAGPEEKAAFAAWLKESLRHVEEFLYVSAVDREFTDAPVLKHIELPLETLRCLDLEPPMEVRSGWESLKSIPVSTRPQARWIWAAALMGIVALGGWLSLSDRSGWQRYVTEVGEQRAFELEDGSVMHLNTRSQVQVRFSETSRDVRMVAGEALFKVAQSPSRPFSVFAGDTVIRAIGTQFNVYRQSRGTKVAVIEGRVQVSTENEGKVMAAGEQANVTPRGQITAVSSAGASEAIAWRQRRLVFRYDRLADVAAEFNRYNRRPRIRVADPAIGERRLTGVFDADDPESLVEFLSRDPELKLTSRAEELVIQTRH